MSMKRFLSWLLVSLILIGGAVYGVWRIYLTDSYCGQPIRVCIPAGADAASVNDSLRSALGSFGGKVYRLWDILNGDPAVAHGSYAVDSGMKAMDVARAISGGCQTPLRVTVNNIRTFGDLAGMFSRKLEFDSIDFVVAADSVLSALDYERDEFPAAVLPDTYEFYWTAKPESVLNRMVRVRDSFWDSTRVARALELGLTPVQVSTIASIVEEETAKTDERPSVARLYLNRLERGMMLQADPTVKFAIGDFSLRRVTAGHLSIDSPYNTYRVHGLPPGPIRIVERASIDAVLNAPEHNYLYMCAKDDFSGYHHFSTTYDRHCIYSARYHRVLNARGIN